MLRPNPYLQLIRPANLITAATDIIAGAALATLIVSDTDNVVVPVWGFILLLLASICLYAGGIAFNDVFDRNIDRIERPDRPIPSGKIPVGAAAASAAVLLIVGILLAGLHETISGLIALFIAVLSLVYNKWSKHHAFSGPLNMGILRGLNLLLGLSLIPWVLIVSFDVIIVPVLYIFSITMVSRGEVHGSSRTPLQIALALFLLTDMIVLYFGRLYNKFWLPLIFVLIHLIYIIPPLWKSIKEPSPGNIRNTVMRGVLGIILLDAIWVSMTGYWWFAFLLLSLLPLSLKLGRYFSVT